MNIFYLDHDPRLAAKYHCDKHVVKMILETAQLLSTALRVSCDAKDISAELYKVTHKNHPSAIWCRFTHANYQWTYQLFLGLLDEYKLRYNRTHASARLIDALRLSPWQIEKRKPIVGFTRPALAMPDDCKLDCPVESYRLYYRKHKSDIAQWNHSLTPDWYSCI